MIRTKHKWLSSDYPACSKELERRFRDEALTSAAQAATIILDGVKADRWRTLVGADAHKVGRNGAPVA